jgi:hypothetical protein
MTTLNIQSFPGEVAITSNLSTDNGSFIVDSVGNRVGINSTTPQYDLDVDGNALFEKTNGSVNVLTVKNGNKQLVFKNTNGTNGEIYAYDSSGTPSYDTLDVNEDMTITSDGKIGIGITNPTNPLEVDPGNASAYMISGNNKIGNSGGTDVGLTYRDRTANGFNINGSDYYIGLTPDYDTGYVQWHENGGFKFGFRDAEQRFSVHSLAPAQKLHVNGLASTKQGIVKVQTNRRTTTQGFNNNSYTTVHNQDFSMVDTGDKKKRLLCMVNWHARLVGNGPDSCYFRITQLVNGSRTERNYMTWDYYGGTGGGGRSNGNCLIGWSTDFDGDDTGTCGWEFQYARASTDDQINMYYVQMTVMQIVDPVI